MSLVGQFFQWFNCKDIRLKIYVFENNSLLTHWQRQAIEKYMNPAIFSEQLTRKAIKFLSKSTTKNDCPYVTCYIHSKKFMRTLLTCMFHGSSQPVSKRQKLNVNKPFKVNIFSISSNFYQTFPNLVTSLNIMVFVSLNAF